MATRADTGFGNRKCEWSDKGDNAGVELQFSRDNALDGDDGRPTRIAGTTGHVSSEEWHGRAPDREATADGAPSEALR
ncbi:hypothetical protein [Streptomyces brasiliensis]|uniref:hypothetical protein n=1 Tax=Streptomyces brasiliensis TaxID=1954 RepID=UPI00166F68D0|nr:hypothetical protein [Streptomyces brasiliensis]